MTDGHLPGCEPHNGFCLRGCPVYERHLQDLSVREFFDQDWYRRDLMKRYAGPPVRDHVPQRRFERTLAEIRGLPETPGR